VRKVTGLRKVLSRADGSEVLVDDETFNAALHAELGEPLSAPSDAVDVPAADVSVVIE